MAVRYAILPVDSEAFECALDPGVARVGPRPGVVCRRIVELRDYPDRQTALAGPEP